MKTESTKYMENNLKDYLRYMGELEIARVDLPFDLRLNLIGQIKEKDMKYLPYLQKGLGVKLI